MCFIKPELQSQTKIVGTVNAKAFFSLPVLSFSPPNVVYCHSVGKSCTPTLKGGEHTKPSQQF